MSFFRFCWKNEKIDWPKCARTIFASLISPSKIILFLPRSPSAKCKTLSDLYLTWISELKDVFERRTSIGSVCFYFWAVVLPTFAANRFYKTEGTKIREKGSFPVVVRCSKTPLLKLKYLLDWLDWLDAFVYKRIL